MTFPETNQGKPSNTAASVTRPAMSASRIGPDETGRPSSSKGGTMLTAKPYLRPCSVRNAGEPARFLPKWKLKPTITPLTANLPTRIRVTKSSAVVAANAELNVRTTAPSSPAAARSRSLTASSVSRNNGSAGWKKSRGWGSNVSTPAGRLSSLAFLRATAMTAWWPRCTPSKLPMARTAPRSAPSGAVSRTTRKRFGAISLHALGKPDVATCRRVMLRKSEELSARPLARVDVGINPLFKPSVIDRPRGTRAAGSMQEKAKVVPPPARALGSITLALDPSMSVLVVDDYSTMVRIIRNLLRQLGFTDVDDAADGSAALAKMHAKHYGLVISDWNMEPMTGFELLQEVRTDPNLRETPFIMVTAESKTENVIAARKAGVNNYIVKPFNAQTLKAKIEAVFAGGTKP